MPSVPGGHRRASHLPGHGPHGMPQPSTSGSINATIVLAWSQEIAEYLSPGMGFDHTSTGEGISSGAWDLWVPSMELPAYPTSGTPQSSLTVSAGARASAALQNALESGQGSPGQGQMRGGEFQTGAEMPPVTKEGWR